jgi:glyoxylase-like metal-dependent hydrolase (beta-lactamase superfamily II)
MKRLLVLAGIAAIGTSLAAYQAPQQPPVIGTAAQLEVVKLKDNFYVITSSTPTPRESFSGGNVSVVITDSGVTLVDTKLANWGQALLDKLKTITTKPVTTIINTHTHGDHTGNDDKFGKVEIIAQENTKANMAKLPAFAGDKAQYLPSKTFTTKLTVGRGATQIDLYYFGRAHTNGDAVLIFPALRIAQMGDMFAWKDAPRCDTANGGSCVEYPKTVAGAAAVLKNIDTVIPGHSPMMKVATSRSTARSSRTWCRRRRRRRRRARPWTMRRRHSASRSIRATRARTSKAAIQIIYDETK